MAGKTIIMRRPHHQEKQPWIVKILPTELATDQILSTNCTIQPIYKKNENLQRPVIKDNIVQHGHGDVQSGKSFSPKKGRPAGVLRPS